MTDPLESLRLPLRVAPTGGHAEAIERGTALARRRRITAGSAGVAVAVAVALVAVSQTGASGNDSLRYLGGPESSPSPSPTSSPTGLVDGVVGALNPQPTATRHTPGPQESPTDEASAPTSGGGQSAPYIGNGPLDANGLPVIRRIITDHNPEYCAASAEAAGRSVGDGRGNWCQRLAAPTTVEAGRPNELRFELCRLTAADPATLDFATPQEVSIVAKGTPRDDSQLEWYWDQHVEWPQTHHQLTISGGQCAVWYVTWSGQDDTGFAMGQGPAHLSAGIVDGATASSQGGVTGKSDESMGFARNGYASTQVTWA
jgi:hypothetical protein